MKGARVWGFEWGVSVIDFVYARQKLHGPLERQVQVLQRVLGVVCSTGLGADRQARLESILEQIRAQSIADSEMVSCAWRGGNGVMDVVVDMEPCTC